MRAKEFISEAGSRLTKRQQQSSKGIHRYHDAQKSDSTYVGFRLGQAVAMSNGENDIDFDEKSWVGKNKTAHPYTKEEAEMLKQAYAAVGAAWEDLNHGDLESKELDTINKFGPVPDRKKLKK